MLSAEYTADKCEWLCWVSHCITVLNFIEMEHGNISEARFTKIVQKFPVNQHKYLSKI